MAVSAFPALVDALVGRMEAAKPVGTIVYDGAPNSDDPADFLAVGVPGIDDDSQAFAGSAEQEWATTSSSLTRDEAGVINCVAGALSTDDTVKDARDRAFAIYEAVASVCRTKDAVTNAPNLGVSSVLWVSHGGQMNAYELLQEGQPVAYAVEFQIAWRARI